MDDTVSTIQPPRRHPGAKNIPLADIIEYVNKGLGPTEIGRLLGCDKSNITKRLQYHGYSKEGVERFKTHKADLLAHVQSKILDAINPSDIKRASLKDKTVAMGILMDKEHQLRNPGQSGHVSIYLSILQQAAAPQHIDEPTQIINITPVAPSSDTD